MKCIKIGLLRETKTPPDRRVALPPHAAAELIRKFPGVQIVVQPSPIRCYADQEFLDAGFALQEDMAECDLLIGIKEVSIPALIPGKTYLFFAHVAKRQAYNKALLKEIVNRGITLIDYEYLTEPFGTRMIAFGRWAGIVGAYNGIRAWGLKTGRYELVPAHDCHNRAEMDSHLPGLPLGPLRILVTGGGRVASGAIETLGKTGIREVTPDEYLAGPGTEAVFCRIDPEHYAAHRNGQPFSFDHFCKNPGEYVSTFRPYNKNTDLLIAAHYWDPAAPKLWEPAEMSSPEFRIRVIADISCDINGSVPSTIRATSIADPFYDFDRIHLCEMPPFSGPGSVTVMSIDNLPGELPRDASEEFSAVLMEKIIPCFLGDDPCHVLDRATITEGGKITERFGYLEEWIN